MTPVKQSLSFSLLLFSTFLAVSCQDPKSASKANFKRAIQAALDNRPACLSISLPNSPRSAFNGQPRTDPQSEALVVAGLASKRSIMMPNIGSALFGGPKELPGTAYDLTADGRKYIGHPHGAFIAQGANSICYGTPDVIEIVRYSEPASAMGQTITEVTYTSALKAVAPWAKDTALSQQFPELTRIKTRNNPGEQKIALVLMSDGWRVPESSF